MKSKHTSQKTQGASVKSGLSGQAKITKKSPRGDTTGQRPKCPKEKGPGPYTFKA